MEPLVSICCLAYNHEPYIKQCLEGFLIQKANFPFEILIHDDASTDNTQDIIREYELKYPEIIKPIYQHENQYSKGVGVTRVFQFPRARGKYIAFCEGDDYWTEPYKLQKQVDFLEANPGYSMCVGGYLKYEEESGRYTEVNKTINNDEYFNNGFSFNLNDLTKGWLTKTLTAFFRKDILNKLDLTYYKYGRDIHLFYHILKVGGPGFYFNDIFGVYRIHKGGVNSSNKGRINLNTAYNIYKEMYEHNKDDFTRYMYLRHSLKLFNYSLYNKDADKTTWKQLKLFASCFKLIRNFRELQFFIIELIPKQIRTFFLKKSMSYRIEARNTELREKERLLIIANASTYHDRPRGIQVNRLITELSSYFDIHLITSRHSIPNNGVEYFDGTIKKITVVRGSSKLFILILKKIWRASGSFDIMFALRAFFKGRKIIIENNIIKVLCLSMRNAVPGTLIKRAVNRKIKVVSFFSDPLSDNPYLVNSDISRKITEKIEKYLFNFSDVNIFPSRLMTDHYARKYSKIKNRFNYIPHCYIPFIGNNKKSIKQNRSFIIRHLGGLNELRNPFTLIDYFLKHNSDFLARYGIVFEFYGRYSYKIQQQIENSQSLHFKFFKEVSYSEAILLHDNSDALLVIDANISPSLFLPSKLIEVLPYNKPIIILTTEGSESDHVGKMLNHHILYHHNLSLVTDVLKNIIIKEHPVFDSSEFSVENVAKQYLNCFIEG